MVVGAVSEELCDSSVCVYIYIYVCVCCGAGFRCDDQQELEDGVMEVDEV